MWTALSVISVIALFLSWKGRNAIWGGLTYGFIFGIVLVVVRAILGHGFSLQTIGKSVVVGVLLGIVADFIGRMSDVMRRKGDADLEERARMFETQSSETGMNLEESFPLWWLDNSEIEDGLEGALNLFMDRHNLPAEGETPEDVKLRILERSGLTFDDPEGEAMLDSYKMSLRLSGFADRLRNPKSNKPRDA